MCSIALCNMGCSKLAESSVANLNRALDRALPGKLIEELHSKMRLSPGLNERGAAIYREEGEDLNPGSAALLAMVDNRLYSDAVPKDAHHNRGQSLSVIQ